MKKYFYLFQIQYLGFRYHGWQKQPGVKTIESMLEKTARFVLEQAEFKILGASRTDAMVSAGHAAFELFVDRKFDTGFLLTAFNLNLPNDIRVIKVESVDERFNIIQAPVLKEYVYRFSHGHKAHPFCAGLLYSFQENLDIDAMKNGARLFEGTHNYRQYCTQPTPGAVSDRTIDTSRIEENKDVTGDFFPCPTFCYRVISKGFMRNQVRLMMGQLLRLGRGEIRLDDIRHSLTGKDNTPLPVIAPASGLVLNRMEFDRPVQQSG